MCIRDSSNEVDLTASGELDNGYTWKYQVQLDTASNVNDDTRLELGTEFGTIGFYVTEGGMSQELHGVGALGAGFDYVSPSTFNAGYDVDGYSNIQYHTAADMLPFGAQVKLGYVPNMAATTQISAKESNSPASAGESTGRNLTQVAVSLAPIDGLTIQGDAAETSNETGTSGPNGKETGVSANIGAKYTIGQLSIGYVEGAHQPAISSGELAYYENKFYGVQFDVNDALSVSYNVDESEKNTNSGITAGNTSRTKTIVAMEQDTIQLAYTAGGATLTSVTPVLDGSTAVCDFADVSWTSASFTANGALIYNSSASNVAVCAIAFGSDKTATNGTFTIQFPTADATNAII